MLEQCPEDLRGWQWRHLWHISDESVMTIGRHEGPAVSAVAISPEAPGVSWNGLMDDVRIYSYALSEAEVQAL